jgi:hypothetical protein
VVTMGAGDVTALGPQLVAELDRLWSDTPQLVTRTAGSP